MAKYQNMVFSTAMRLLANPTEAQDIAQEVFLRAYERFTELGQSPTAGGWLRTVATNLSLNHLTRYRARWSFFSAFCAWLPGVLAVVSAIESGLILIQYLVPTWFVTPLQQGIAIVLILIVPTAMACLPLRWLKHILLLVAALYVGVFLLRSPGPVLQSGEELGLDL